MARAIATVGGTALTPGVSRNRRWYTRQMIAGAVARAQERIAAGHQLAVRDRREGQGRPLATLTHHDAGDDSTRIAGRVTSLHLDRQGRARFTAEIADTAAGRDIAALVDTSDDRPPFLDGVSIRGVFSGNIREVTAPDGGTATTADDLELAGLDYTGSPGVPGAAIDTFAWGNGPGAPKETSDGDGQVLITESVQEAQVTFTETTEPGAAGDGRPPAGTSPPADAAEALARVLGGAPTHHLENGLCVTCDTDTAAASETAGAAYADPGYQADHRKRYRLDTAGHAKAAWSALAHPAAGGRYTAQQHHRIKSRVAKALRRFGDRATTGEGWVIDPPTQVTEAIAEALGDPSTAGCWSIHACNGPVDIHLSSYSMDPADLQVILRAAADAAVKALRTLDPDMDGDVDVPGAPDADTDHDKGNSKGESAASPAGQGTGETTAEADVPHTTTPPPDGAPARGEAREDGTRAAEPVEEKKKVRYHGVTKAMLDKCRRDIKKDPANHISMLMRRLCEWAASGNYPHGMTYSDLRKLYNICAKELHRRDPKSTAGGSFPKKKG